MDQFMCVDNVNKAKVMTIVPKHLALRCDEVTIINYLNWINMHGHV
jgi:hypothetical protein